VSTVGKTISTERYFSNVSTKDFKNLSLDLEDYYYRFTNDVFFPLKTTMSPKRIDSRAFSKPQNIKSPFAVVGNDELSRQWLQFRYEKLVSMNAFVLVVKANDLLEISDMSEKYSPLKFYPANGDSVAETFKLDSYPVMINSEGVWQ